MKQLNNFIKFNVMRLSIFTLLALTYVPVSGQTISDLTSTSQQATVELEYIYGLDIFSYYKLNDYDTELKRSVFQKSEEGQNKFNELKSIKAEMLKTTYYIKQSGYFTNENYDIQKKGFNIKLGWVNVNLKSGPPRTPKSIAFDETEKSRILLKALPSKKVRATPWKPSMKNLEAYAEELFISMGEESGLEVENDKENTEVYFFFTPNGREKTVFKLWDMDNSNIKSVQDYEFIMRNPQYIKYKLYDITNNDLKTDKVRIVVANSLSGKILYDKFFSYQVPATKK